MIKGWDEALLDMKGELRMLKFRRRWRSRRRRHHPADAALVFYVELVTLAIS